MIRTAALVALVPAPVFTARFVINDGQQSASIAQVMGGGPPASWRERCLAAVVNAFTAARFGAIPVFSL